MAKGSMNIGIKGFGDLQKKIEDLKKKGGKALQRTVSDFKSRAPGWVSTAVTSIYNIKKAEVSGAKTDAKKAGTIKVKGEEIDNMQIVFQGRLLTPVHFGMTPKKPPKGKSYTLKETVYKGKQKVIGRFNRKKIPGGPYSDRSHNILMPTGASSADKVPYIPFQRMSKNRKDIKKFTSTSIPQMITNEDVSKEIYTSINDNLSKRLEHNLQSQMNK
jgi:hypothetical protein